MTNGENRFTRQAGLVPRERLEHTPVTVIGCGAIGRQVALQLAAIGATGIQLIDFDKVDETNITTQGYHQAQVGAFKPQAAAEEIRRIDPSIVVHQVCDRYRPKLPTNPAVFCCVDSITTREVIWRSLKERCHFWADGRMQGETLRILAADDDPFTKNYYATTLFTAAETQEGACTEKSTIYTASIAAGFMVHQFTRFLRQQPVDVDMMLNLMASELVMGEEANVTI